MVHAASEHLQDPSLFVYSPVPCLHAASTMGRPQNVAYHDLVRPEEEDWHMLQNSAERRRIQNRLAQRAYRRNIKYQSLELEKLKHELTEMRKKQGQSDDQDQFTQDDTPTQPEQNTLAVPQQWPTDFTRFWPQQSDRVDGRPRAVSASVPTVTADKTTTLYAPQPCGVTQSFDNRPRAVSMSPNNTPQRSASLSSPASKRIHSPAQRHSLCAIPDGQYMHLEVPSIDPSAAQTKPQPVFMQETTTEPTPMDIYAHNMGFAPHQTQFGMAMDSSAQYLSHSRRDSTQSVIHHPHQPQAPAPQQPQPTNSHEPSPAPEGLGIAMSGSNTSWLSSASNVSGAAIADNDDGMSTTSSHSSSTSTPHNQQNLLKQQQQQQGQSLLHIAAQHGHRDILRLLLQRGGIDINGRDATGCTPLQLAVATGRTEIVQLLLDHGADMTTLMSLTPAMSTNTTWWG